MTEFLLSMFSLVPLLGIPVYLVIRDRMSHLPDVKKSFSTKRVVKAVTNFFLMNLFIGVFIALLAGYTYVWDLKKCPHRRFVFARESIFNVVWGRCIYNLYLG
jgi:hypothetical protein